MKHFAKILALLLAVAMVIGMLPAVAFAQEPETEPEVVEVVTPEHEAELQADVLGDIGNYFTGLNKKNSSVRKQDYYDATEKIKEIVLASDTYVEDSLVERGSGFFWQTTTGITCGYFPEHEYKMAVMRANNKADTKATYATASACTAYNNSQAGSNDVCVVGPMYSEDDSFTEQYGNEAADIAAATGGTAWKLINSNATVTNIANAISKCKVVIFDSHGNTDWGYFEGGSDGSGEADCVTQANTSYLCLSSGTGITSTDMAYVTKVNSNSYTSTFCHAYSDTSGNYVIDGTAIANHMSTNAPGSLLWMAICLGMATPGLEQPLHNKGVSVVYGYSQSVTFSGEYAYEADFWDKMIAGETVATAAAYMKTHNNSNWDPYYTGYTIANARKNYAAFPIVVSDQDVYPGQRTSTTTYDGTVDAVQTVNSTWKLLGEPEPATVTLMAGSTQYGSTINTTTNTNATLPSYSGTVPTGYTFAGWTDAAISGTTNAKPTLYNGTYPTGSNTASTLYACFSKADANGGSGDYEKVVSTRANSDFADGTYLIVCESNNVAFDGSLATLDAVSNTISVTISDNTIESNATTDAAAFTYSSADGSFLSGSGNYIGRSANTNGLDSSTSALSNTVSLNGTDVDIVGAGGAYLRYNPNSGQTRFRYFKSSTYSSQQPIQLYKLSEGSTTYTTTISTCNHNWQVSETVAATCTATGAIEYTCSICSDTYIEETPALGHNMVAGTVHAATCTEDGYTEYACSRCDATDIGDIVAATGHNYVNGVCSVCGAEEPETPAVTSGWYLVDDYTNLEDGVYAIISPNNYAFNGTITSGHGQKTADAFVWDANGYAASAPEGTLELTFTTTANGFTLYNETLGYLYASKASSGGLAFHASEDSGWSFSTDGGLYAANNAHLRSYNDTFRTYAGNSNATIGLAHKVEGAPHEHTPENVAAVAATCTTAGTTAGTVCSVCGAVLSGCEEIAALGHDWVAGTPVAATCTEDGYTPYTCSRCSETKQEAIPATGHVDANSDDVCDVCGADLSTPAGDDFSGDYYIAAIRTTGNYQWMTNDLGTASTKRYQAEDSGLDTLPAAITENVDSAKVWTLAKQQDGTYLLSSGGNYSTWSTGNSADLGETGASITVTANGDAVQMTISDGTRYLSLNSTAANNYFAYYGGTQINDLYLVPVNGTIAPACEHTNTTTTGALAATCTTDGYTGDVVCSDCGAIVTAGSVIPATGHVDANSDDVCDVCGADLSTPAVTSGWYLVDDYTNLEDGVYAIISPNNYAFNGTITSGHGQKTADAFVWDANGYAASAPEGTLELTFTTTANGFTLYNETLGYLYASKASSGGLAFHASEDSGWSFSTDGGLYAANNAHLRSYNDTFRTYASNSNATIGLAHKVESAVQHEHTPENVAAVAATCTTAGTTAGTVCSVCGAVLSGCEEIAALGHDWVAGTPVAATCTEDGYTPYTCSRCSETKQEAIPATGHVDANSDDVCDVCGADLSTPAVTSGWYLVDDYTNLEDGVYAIISPNNYAFNGTITSGHGQKTADAFVWDANGYAASAPEGTLELTFTTTANGFTLYNETLGYLYASKASSGGLAFHASEDSGWSFSTDGGLYAANNAHLRSYNDTFRTYAGNSNATIGLAHKVEGAPHEHTPENVAAVAATCTTAGTTAGTVCSVCGAVLSGCEEIAALGHDWVAGTPVAATCTEDGYTPYTCSRCSETKQEAIPATGHVDANSDDVCDVCGADLSTPAGDDFSGDYYIAAIRTTGNYQWMTNDLGTASTKRYQAEDSGLTTLPAAITENVDAAKTWTLAKQQDGTYLLSSGGSYSTWTTGNSADLGETGAAITITANGDAVNLTIPDGESVRYLSLNSNATNNFFAYYTSTQTNDLYLVPVTGEVPTPETHTATYFAGQAATCTEPGVSAYWYCAECLEDVNGEHYGIAYSDEGMTTVIADTVIAALGHDWVAGTPVAATCTEDGYTPLTCSRCDATDMTAIVAATGHTSSYVDNGNGTHDEVCSVCGTILTDNEEHVYDGGYCIGCGAIEPAAELTDPDLTIVSTSLSLQSYIGAQFAVNTTAAAEYDSVYVVVTQSTPSGDLEYTLTDNIGAASNSFAYEHKLAAAEMTDNISATVYGVKGEDVYAGGSVENWTVKQAAVSRLDQYYKYVDRYPQYRAYCVMVVDMLNYGAEAQTTFNRATNRLANADLDSKYVALGTATTPTIADTSAVTATGATGVTVYSTALGVEASVQLQVTFKLPSKASYTNYEVHYSINGRSYVIDGADLANAGSSSYVTLVINEVASAEMRLPVSVTVYTKSTSQPASATYTYSVESAAYPKVGTALDGIVKAMIRYGDSADAYFNYGA